MEGILLRLWKEAVAQVAETAAIRREDELEKERLVRRRNWERDREEQAAEKQKDKEDLQALEEALAPQQEIAAFRFELDDYDTGTVEALMDKQEALDIVREKLDAVLGKAEVLPDGRRVFKTVDGQRVFDEFGQELSREAIDPNSIDNRKPKWETYKGYKDEDARLMEERQQLLDYQAKLDAARERLDQGDITERELKEIRTELKADMPEAVREKLGLDKEDQRRDAGLDGPGASAPLPGGMDDLMRQTGRGPVPTRS